MALLSLMRSHVLSTTWIPADALNKPVPIAPDLTTTHTSVPPPIEIEGEIADAGGWSL